MTTDQLAKQTRRAVRWTVAAATSLALVAGGMAVPSSAASAQVQAKKKPAQVVVVKTQGEVTSPVTYRYKYATPTLKGATAKDRALFAKQVAKIREPYVRFLADAVAAGCPDGTVPVTPTITNRVITSVYQGRYAAATMLTTATGPCPNATPSTDPDATTNSGRKIAANAVIVDLKTHRLVTSALFANVYSDQYETAIVWAAHKKQPSELRWKCGISIEVPGPTDPSCKFLATVEYWEPTIAAANQGIPTGKGMATFVVPDAANDRNLIAPNAFDDSNLPAVTVPWSQVVTPQSLKGQKTRTTIYVENTEWFKMDGKDALKADVLIVAMRGDCIAIASGATYSEGAWKAGARHGTKAVLFEESAVRDGWAPKKARIVGTGTTARLDLASLKSWGRDWKGWATAQKATPKQAKAIKKRFRMPTCR